MSAPGLTEFLLARIAEREVTYRLHNGVHIWVDGFMDDGYTGVQVRHSDRRVLPNAIVREKYMTAVPADETTLRECAAFRKIVRRAQSAEDALLGPMEGSTYFIRLACRDSWRLALSDLGTIWSTHPDYDERWRP